MYAYLQMGKEREAKAILDGLPALAARFDPNAITGAAPGSAGVFALAAIPARWALERRAWAEAAALEPKASDFPHTEAMTYFARALGASRTGDLGKGEGRRRFAGVDSAAAEREGRRHTGRSRWRSSILAARAWLASRRASGARTR